MTVRTVGPTRLKATLDFLNNLIKLYEAWGKPEKAEEWRVTQLDSVFLDLFGNQVKRCIEVADIPHGAGISFSRPSVE